MTEPRVTPMVWLRRACDAALLAAIVLFVWSTLPGVRTQPGFDELVDGWVQGGAYVLTAVVAALRPLTDPRRRAFWSLVALGLALRACGFVLYLSQVRLIEPTPYPSIADAAWLASSIVFLVAAWLLARHHLPHYSRLLAIDALLAAVATGGVVLAVIYEPLQALTPTGSPADVVATNLAYPLVDLAILIVMVGILAETGWRPPAATALLTVGLGVTAAVDVVHLYRAATGTHLPGTWLAALALLGTAAVAWSGRFPEGTGREDRAQGSAPIVATAVLAMLCLVVMLYDTIRAVPMAAVLLSGTGVALAIARGLLTFYSDRRRAIDTIAAKDEEIELFQALVEASDDFIAIATVDGRVVYLNPAGKRLIGLPDNVDVAGTQVGEYVPAVAGSTLGGARPGLLERGSWRGHSELLDQRGGPPIPVTANTFVLRDPDTGGAWLLATVQRDISELRTAQADLQRVADERQTLLSHLVEAQEAERAKVAADVHDDSVQALAAVDLHLGLLRRRLGTADSEVLGTIDDLHDRVRGATDRLRHLLFDLDSPAQRTDLVSALEEAAATVFEGSVRWRVEREADEVDLPEARRVMAHRMAKEAMVNIVKHARATTAVITARRVDGGVEVAVLDDGVGIAPGDVELRPGHRGLADMRDRAAIAGGWIEVGPRPEGGTSVRMWLPSADPA